MSSDDSNPAPHPRAVSIPPAPASGSKGVLRRVGRGAIWVVGGRLLGVALAVIMSGLLSRLLAPADFGQFLVLLNLLAFAATLATLGLGIAVVRFIAEILEWGDARQASRATALIWQVAATAMVVVGGGSFLALRLGAADWLKIQASTGNCLLAALAAVLLAAQQLGTESLRGYHELRFTSFLSGGQVGSPLAGVLFLTVLFAAANWISPDLHLALTCLVIGLAVSVMVTLALLVRTARHEVYIGRSVDPRRSTTRTVTPLSLPGLLSVSLPMLGLQLLAFVTLWGDLWIAGVFCSEDELAWYAASRRLLVLLGLPLQMVMLTVLPSIAGLYAAGKSKEIQIMLRGAAGLAALPAGVAALAMIAAPGLVLRLYYGPFYEQGAWSLAILACGQLVVLVCGLGGYTLLMTGRHYTALLVNLATALYVLAAAPFAAAKFGVLGLSTVAATAAAIQATSEWLLAHQLLGIWTHAGLAPAYASLLAMFHPAAHIQPESTLAALSGESEPGS